MVSDKCFQLKLLHLIHSLINADGTVNEDEARVLWKIKEKEKIPSDVTTKIPKTIYQDGITLIHEYDDRGKLNALAKAII